MAMKFDGVSETQCEYNLGDDYEHRDAEHEHEEEPERVFMNSSVLQFAECLCLFSEFMRTKDAETFTRHVELVDSAALAAGTFWPNEMRCELDV